MCVCLCVYVIEISFAVHIAYILLSMFIDLCIIEITGAPMSIEVITLVYCLLSIIPFALRKGAHNQSLGSICA